MCELFGVSGQDSISVNHYLKEFTSHSTHHPNGWGMAIFYDNAVNLEKEPIRACDSNYLRERLKHPFQTRTMMAHIRLATRGIMNYENCHPFVKRDDSDRAWTLIHNGTIFESKELDRYVGKQNGATDSERILLYLIDQINYKMREKGDDLMEEERFEVVDSMIHKISLHNKVNLLIYDGELFYVHTNLKNSLYQKQHKSAMIFATVPLDDEEWKPVEFMTLLAYQEGKLRFIGRKHENEYIENPENMKLLFLDYANL